MSFLRSETSAAYGVRGGYWFQPDARRHPGFPWLGLAGDLSHFEAKADNARFRLTLSSLLVMLRLPLLTTDEIPQGLQPYVGLGPSLLERLASDRDRKIAETKQRPAK